MVRKHLVRLYAKPLRQIVEMFGLVIARLEQPFRQIVEIRGEPMGAGPSEAVHV